MLFTSSAFLFLFFPAVLIGFFTLGHFKRIPALLICVLVAASIIFYGYKDPANILILLFSVLGNYGIAHALRKTAAKKTALIAGIVFNIALLAYFKYTNFILSNASFLTQADFGALDIALPLAISFYTFQQIAYLADTYEGKVKDESFLNYLLFVTFFPQLIIGPIVHHSEMMPQFKLPSFGKFNWEDFKVGYFYLLSGLIKKIIFSDSCAHIVDAVYGTPDMPMAAEVGFAAAWVATIAFSFQIYFDFSGYSDMALGIARMLGIKIPINFDSPYRAKNVSEFWRRWHITFSRWLSDYLYIPLGGNKKGKGRAALNAFVVFLLGGLWHGAAWTFVLWGLMQGAGLSVSKYLERRGVRTSRALAVFLTFIFITLTWVVFRSASLEAAGNLYAGLFGLHGFSMALPQAFHDHIGMFLLSALFVFALPNTHKFIPKVYTMSTYVPQAPVIVAMLVLWLAMAAFDLDSSAEFIYFDF